MLGASWEFWVLIIICGFLAFAAGFLTHWANELDHEVSKLRGGLQRWMRWHMEMDEHIRQLRSDLEDVQQELSRMKDDGK